MAQGENFLENLKNNKKYKFATYAIVGVLVIVAAYFLYKEYVYKPSNERSKTIYWPEMVMMQNDSLDFALDGFQSYAKKYDGKAGGEVSSYLAGRILMDKGEFEMALKYLEDAELTDVYVATMVIGLQGDCYSELGNYKKAVELYEKAAKRKPNDYTSPRYLMKAALVYEMELKNLDKAKACYEQVKKDYFEFSKTVNIDKYIARASK